MVIEEQIEVMTNIGRCFGQLFSLTLIWLVFYLVKKIILRQGPNYITQIIDGVLNEAMNLVQILVWAVVFQMVQYVIYAPPSTFKPLSSIWSKPLLEANNVSLPM